MKTLNIQKDIEKEGKKTGKCTSCLFSCLFPCFLVKSAVFLAAAVEMLPPPRPYSPQDYSLPSPDFQDPQRSSAVPSPVQLDGNNNTVRTGGLRGGCGGGC